MKNIIKQANNEGLTMTKANQNKEILKQKQTTMRNSLRICRNYYKKTRTMIIFIKNYKILASERKISSNISRTCQNNQIYEGKMKNNSNKLIMRVLTITKVSITITV